MFGVDQAGAQQVQARVVAHPGPATDPPTEPAIAGGEHAILALFFSPANQYADMHKASYASRAVGGPRWARHTIEGPFQHIGDVSVAYEAPTGGFLAAAMAGDLIVTCRFEPGPTAGELIPGTWKPVVCDPQLGAVDKPWIVAGCQGVPPGLENMEYYIVCGLVSKYYLHSTNGGQSWRAGGITVDGSNIEGAWGAQPAVHADGPLYVAYITAGHIRFVVGEDQPDGTVSFAYLLQSADPAVPVSIPLREDRVYDELPGAFSQRVAARIPYLAVDPSEPTRLYVAYHDVDENDDTDVNIYLNRLTKSGDVWSVTDQIKVNNDDTEFESDQFMPMLTVDDVGRLHVIFYDDRRFNVLSDQVDGAANADFDVYYAFSENQGQAWGNERLFLVENEAEDPPALLRRQGIHIGNPREYNGIAWYRYDSGVRVFTAYTGTDDDDPDPDDGTIWSSAIEWSN